MLFATIEPRAMSVHAEKRAGLVSPASSIQVMRAASTDDLIGSVARFSAYPEETARRVRRKAACSASARPFSVRVTTVAGEKVVVLAAIDQVGGARALVAHRVRPRIPTVSPVFCDSGVMVFDHSRVLYVNRTLSRLLCIRPERLTGQPLTEMRFFQRMEPLSLLYNKIMNSDIITRSPRIVGPCGLNIKARARMRACMFEGKQAVLLEISSRDDELVDSATAWQLRGELFSSITHEMRVQLNIISGAARLIDIQCGGEESKYSAILTQNISTMMRLCNNVIDLDRINNGTLRLRMSNTELNGFLRGIAENVAGYAADRGITFSLRLPDTPAPATCDTVYFERCVYNLLSNAVKFTPAGGKITLSLTVREGEAQIAVQDTGKGITKEHLSRIFDRCFVCDTQSASNGSGIGLSLVRRVMELHGGSVTVSSHPDKGSTFTLHLPLGVAASPEPGIACLGRASASVEMSGLTP